MKTNTDKMYVIQKATLVTNCPDNARYATRNITPVKISINGYCQDMRDLHPRHLPRWIRKLMTGTNSVQDSFFLQVGQNDLPESPMPEFHLSPTTFKKLPHSIPRIRRKIESNSIS